MAIFAIHYTYADDATEMMTVRPDHREWLSGLPGLLVAGMYQPGIDAAPTGELDPRGAGERGAHRLRGGVARRRVRTTFDEDPYWRAGGIITRRVVRTWDPPLGPWVADATQSLA